MTKEVSTKSTKNEILEAYNELLDRVKQQKSVDRKAQKKKEEEIKVVETATQNSADRIVKALGELKVECVNILDNLGGSLLVEHKTLTDLQQAIEIEKRGLDELYEIKVNTDSLAALLLAQKEKKSAFDAEMEEKRKDFDEEMSQKRQQWKQEEENYEFQKRERDAQLKRDRQREEEQYTYELQTKRKKESDLYDARKASLEKELADRETALAVREKELADLKGKVESFPAEMEKAIKQAEKGVQERLEGQYRHQAEVAQKELEGERKLTKHIISSLENKIKEQEELIRQLSQRASEAVSQVQSIAVKALEGAAVHRAFAASHDKGSETAKG